MANDADDVSDTADVSGTKHKLAFIDIQCKQKGEQLLIIVKNSYKGILEKDYSSTKSETRGLGLLNIYNETVDKGTYLAVDHEDGVFTLRAVLSNNTKLL